MSFKKVIEKYFDFFLELFQELCIHQEFVILL